MAVHKLRIGRRMADGVTWDLEVVLAKNGRPWMWMSLEVSNGLPEFFFRIGRPFFRSYVYMYIV